MPTAGESFISGVSILSSPLEVKKKIGVLPEDLALFDSLTIWERISSGETLLFSARTEEGSLFYGRLTIRSCQ